MKNSARTGLLLWGDIVALTISFFFMLTISFRGQNFTEALSLHKIPFLILSGVWILIFFLFNLYEPHTTKPTIPHLKQIFMAFTVALIAGIALFYFIPFFDITPKTNLAIFGTSSIVFFIIWRRIFYHIFSAYFQKTIAFVIEENKKYFSLVDDLKNYISTYPQSGFKVVGTYPSIQALDLDFEDKKLDMIIVSKEIWRDSESFKKINNTQSEVLDLATAYENILGRIPVEAIDEGWFMYNSSSYQNKIYDTEKRLVDTTLACLGIIILSPVIFLSAILIKISDGGSVFYSQERVGRKGKIFRLYKFRSMIENAEKDGAEWAQAQDLRVTNIGKYLRKLHIDEIPQLLNILKGDIDLVGPRPERPEFVAKLEKEIPFYHLRHTITPGFTGWAQIKFRYARNILDSKQKFEYDLFYLKNKSFFMDFGIILRTVQIIFMH